MADFDAKSPNVARVYDALLGGKDNFTTDRSQTGQILDVAPMLADMAAENRRFQGRAVTWLANQGVAQFADLGCGMPNDPNTHDTAQAASPSARVAYVDTDPVVLSHMTAVTKGVTGASVTNSDVRDPRATIAALGEHLDFTAPVCLLMCALLHFFDADSAREAVTEYAAALAPGSYILASVATGEGEVADRFVAEYSKAVAPIYTHPLPEFAGFFDGLEIVPPGVAPVDTWRPEWAEVASPDRPLWGYVVAARTH